MKLVQKSGNTETETFSGVGVENKNISIDNID